MMDFEQAYAGFQQLKQQFDSGQLTEADFKTKLQDLMVQDDQGTWWMIGHETGQWYRYDGTDWIQEDPPAVTAPHQPVAQIPLEPTTRHDGGPRSSPGSHRLSWPLIGIVVVVVVLGSAGALIFSGMTRAQKMVAT